LERDKRSKRINKRAKISTSHACAIMAIMSERTHPERRPTESFRSIVEIAHAREKLKRGIDDSSYTREEFVASIALQDLMGDDQQTKKTVGKLLPIEIQLSKARGWRDGLNFVFGKSISGIGNNAHPDITVPQASRSDMEIEQARSVIQENVKVAEQKMYATLEDYEHDMEERASISVDGYIDLQMLLGETKTYPTNTEEFFKSDSRKNVTGMMFFEGEIGIKEALDWVLLEEDENNGMAKSLSEKRENPPKQ
jgi:hypothetical protein